MSIPLPALSVNPPAPAPDPVAQYGRLLQLRQTAQEAPLRQQALQQQVQSGQLGLQQQQIQLKDQQAMTAAMQQWDGKSLNDLPGLVLKNGGSAQAVIGLKSKSLDMEKQYSDIAAQDATTGSKNIETMMKKNDAVSGAFSTVLQSPDQELPQAVISTAQNLAQQGLLDPQHLQLAQNLVQSSAGDPAKLRSSLDIMRKGMLADSQLLTDAQKQAQTSLTQAQTQKTQQEMMFGPSGPAAQAKYRFILQKKAAGQTLTPDELNFARGYEASEAKSTATSDSLGIMTSNFSKPAGLSAVGGAQGAPRQGAAAGGGTAQNAAPSPSKLKEDTVDLIGQYRADPGLVSRMLYRHPEMIGLIQARYPNWDQTAYQAKNKIVQSYTSGPESRSINAIGTALGHADELRNAIDALGNGDAGIKALRDIGNRIGVQVGNDRITAFNTIVHRLAPEITAAYVQGGGGEGERAAAAEDFSPGLSRQQLLSNWGETVKLLQSKIAQQKQQWDTTYRPTRPEDDFFTRFMSPVAKDAISRWQSETGNQSNISGARPQTLDVGSIVTQNGHQFRVTAVDKNGKPTAADPL